MGLFVGSAAEAVVAEVVFEETGGLRIVRINVAGETAPISCSKLNWLAVAYSSKVSTVGGVAATLAYAGPLGTSHYLWQ